MSCDPDDFTYMSLCLSEILYDIGVNEDMVTRTRRAWLLRESLTTVSHRSRGILNTNYIFGSLTEGATTTGLRSDNDFLMFYDNDEVFSDIQECKPGQLYFVIKDNGYCYLVFYSGNNSSQILKERLGLHETLVPDILKQMDGGNYELHGPAISSKGQTTYNDQDYVFAKFCKTWPKCARKWLLEEGVGHWPTKEIKSFAEQSGCFLVPVGIKGSEMEKYEYRISTSLAERALMFSLNITQLRCYILLKMIMKSFINAEGEDAISSYICKTVLFHCIKYTPLNLWHESKLLHCLTLCLSSLQYCVFIGHCPHFIIYDNNLLFGRITSHFRTKCIEIIRKMVLSCGHAFKSVLYESFGERLKMKMNIKYLQLRKEIEINRRIGMLLRDTGKSLQDFYLMTLFKIKYKNKVVALRFLYSCVSELVRIHKSGSRLERLACKLLAAELSSTIGSLLAISDKMSSVSISKASLEWFDASLDSNVSSNRLKLASVFYTAGEINKAFAIIKDVENRYDINTVEPVCRCTEQPSYPARDGFDKAAEHYKENGFKYAVAYCVNFLGCERTCMPKELHFEMFRTTANEQHLRNWKNQWLDLAFVDSLTFLLFLKYKIFGCLGKEAEQSKALQSLIRAIRFESNLGHRETGLNLAGQIMVEEGKLFKALLFFLASYRVKRELNAAKIHLCIVIAKLFNQKKVHEDC